MDPHDPSAWRRPPGPEGPVAPEGRADGEESRERHRSLGLRQVRRLSNWTAVALVAATAVTAGYFARDQASSQQASAQQAAPAAGPRSQAAPGLGAPCVAAPVAVSGGSGVTTPAPAQTCAPGTGGGTPPPVNYAGPRESEGD